MNERQTILREIIDLYVDPTRIERIIYLWEKTKRHEQLYHELLHSAAWFRFDRSIALVPAIDAAAVAQRMHQLGAGKTCLVYGISDYDQNTQEIDLDTALAEYVGQKHPVLLYCRKSKTAFVEEHDGRQLFLSCKQARK